MKMKHYLRGLATGMVIAVTVMSLFQRNKNGPSDEEIRRRAAELGMVMADSGTLASNQQKVDGNGAAGGLTEGSQTSQDEEQNGSDETRDGTGENQESDSNAKPQTGGETEGERKPEESVEPDESRDPQEGVIPEGDGETQVKQPPEESEETGEPENPTGNSGIVTITITPGNGSYAVAQQLKRAGIVDDVEEFDEYLCDHGYDNVLRVGQFQIPVDSTYQDIARILTTRP